MVYERYKLSSRTVNMQILFMFFFPANAHLCYLAFRVGLITVDPSKQNHKPYSDNIRGHICV